jgi:hypothetical protein
MIAQAKPWVGHGVPFGVLVWLLWAVPIFLIQYAGQPFPGSMIAKETELLDMLILLGPIGPQGVQLPLHALPDFRELFLDFTVFRKN